MIWSYTLASFTIAFCMIVASFAGSLLPPFFEERACERCYIYSLLVLKKNKKTAENDENMQGA